MLQCVAVGCSMLQCTCSKVTCSKVSCTFSKVSCIKDSVLQCVAVCCSVLQCVAACCSVLQCTVLEDRALLIVIDKLANLRIDNIALSIINSMTLLIEDRNVLTVIDNIIWLF